VSFEKKYFKRYHYRQTGAEVIVSRVVYIGQDTELELISPGRITMGRLSALCLFVAFTIPAPMQAQGPIPADRNAGPLPFQNFRKNGDAIELTCQITHFVRETRVRAVTEEGITREVTYTVTKPVYETKMLNARLSAVQALLPSGTKVEGAELDKQLENREVVAAFRLDQKPDAAYLNLMKPDTLVVCLPNGQRPFADPPARIRGGPGGAAPRPLKPADAPQPESPRPGTPTAPALRPGGAPATPSVKAAEDSARQDDPTRSQAFSVKFNERGQFELRRAKPAEATAADSKAVAVRTVSPDDVRGYDLKGRPIDQEDLVDLLKRERNMLVTQDGNPPDPFYARILKPDTLILVIAAKP